MGKLWSAFLAVIPAAVLLVGSAAAETRSFAEPAVHGLRLDWCAHFGNGCGKPAADLFCRESGFAEAARFAIAPNIGARGIRTLVFGDGRTCEGPNCSGFSTITCMRQDAPPSAAIRKPPAPPPAVTRVLPAVPPVRKKVPGSKIVPVFPAAPHGPSAAQRKPPPKPGSAETTTALPGGPKLVLSAGALLYRPGGDFKLMTNIDIDSTAPSQSETFAGDVTKVDGADGFVWQVTTAAFGSFGSGSATDLKPIGLRASAYVSGDIATFKLDFKKLATVRGTKPGDFYIRILPLAKAGGVVVGQPSNVIRVYYTSKAPPQPPITVKNTNPPNLFTIKFVSFTPPQFEDPNKWGCVVITGYTAAATSTVKAMFPLKDSGGKPNVVCPKSFTGGGSGQITSFGGFVDWAFDHVTGAWDWFANKYNGLKKLVVDAVGDYTPFGLQCKAAAKLYGKAAGDDDAVGYCHQGAEIAVDAGMTALGVPPTLPSYNELIDAGVDQAVEIAAEKFTEETGLPCPEECKDAMRKGFGAAADNLKKSSASQACVDPSIAHDHGREPLCLPLGVLSKPAPEAISTPPVVIASLMRTGNDRDPKSLFTGNCTAGADLGDFRNVFQGQTVFGPFSDMAVPTQAVTGRLYFAASTALDEAMPKGSTRQIVLIFDHASKFEFPWTHQLWMKSLSPPHDELGPFGPDWFRLYSGAAATVAAGVNCGTTSGPPTVVAMPKLY